MTDIIFCLIFIQVGIFLIAGILLVTSLVFGALEREEVPVRAMARPRPRKQKAVYTPEPLSRPEIEYLLGS